MRKKQKKNFFSKKKIQNGRLKKTTFFKIAKSQNFFARISQIGPWVSRIDWCEGHWFISTYMAVRLSDIRAKTGKKCNFEFFFCFFSMKISQSLLVSKDGSKFWLLLWFPAKNHSNSTNHQRLSYTPPKNVWCGSKSVVTFGLIKILSHPC